MEKTKLCNHCKSLLPISKFHKWKLGKDGLSRTCKKCQHLYHLDWISRNREKHNSYSTNWHYGSFHARWYLWKSEAGKKKKFKVFNITEEYLLELVKKQDWKCKYSGESMTLEKGNNLISLDRIDSGMGYIRGNVQFVCNAVNRMKQEFSESEFLEWCEKIFYNSLAKQTITEKSIEVYSGEQLELVV